MNIERWDVQFDRRLVGTIYGVPHIIEVFPVLKVYDMPILIFLDNVMLTHLPMYNPVCSMLLPHCHHQHQDQRAWTVLMSSTMSMRWWTILRKLYHLQLTPSSSLVILLLCIPPTTTQIYTPPPAILLGNLHPTNLWHTGSTPGEIHSAIRLHRDYVQ